MNSSELKLVETFILSHPDAAARELELQPPGTSIELMNDLPMNQGRQLILHMLPAYAARACAELSVGRVVGLLADSNSNQVAAILRCMSKSKRTALLKGLPEKTATLCRLLLSYSEDTVGAWMTTDIVMLPESCIASEALHRLVLMEISADSNAIPVIDKKHHVVGVVDVRDLLRAKGEASIAHLIQNVPSTLSSRTSLTHAARHEAWQISDTLMVLNRNRELVGVLRHVDLRRSLVRLSEIASTAQKDDVISGIGEAYVGAMSALLSLVCGKPQPAPDTEIQK